MGPNFVSKIVAVKNPSKKLKLVTNFILILFSVILFAEPISSRSIERFQNLNNSTEKVETLSPNSSIPKLVRVIVCGSFVTIPC